MWGWFRNRYSFAWVIDSPEIPSCRANVSSSSRSRASVGASKSPVSETLRRFDSELKRLITRERMLSFFSSSMAASR